MVKDEISLLLLLYRLDLQLSPDRWQLDGLMARKELLCVLGRLRVAAEAPQSQQSDKDDGDLSCSATDADLNARK